MTDDRMALVDLLQKSGDGDFLRSVAEAVLQILMEADVEGLIGAGRHERSGERLNYRNGYRERSLDTRLGSLQLRIPKLRQGRYFPPFLEPDAPPRRRSKEASHAHGRSSRGARAAGTSLPPHLGPLHPVCLGQVAIGDEAPVARSRPNCRVGFLDIQTRFPLPSYFALTH